MLFDIQFNNRLGHIRGSSRQQVQLHQNTFSPVDTWQQYGIYAVYAGVTVTVLKAVWERNEVDQQCILQLEERQRQGAAEETGEWKGGSNRVEINNQIQARPPAVQSSMARISSNILEMASTLWFRKKMLIFLAFEIFLAEIEIMKSKKGKRLKMN